MPYMTVTTNVQKDEADYKKLSVALAELISQQLGKPVTYCAVNVSHEAALSMGGSFDPCAMASLYSIGSFADNEKNVAISSAFAAVVEEHLGVPSNRYYLCFQEGQPHLVGWSGKTFAA